MSVDAPLVRLRNLAAAVGDVEPLIDVSMDLAAGATTGLVGETGSGKSLTLRVLAGLAPRIDLRVIRGSAELEGEDLLGLGERAWRGIRGRRIALVPQGSLGSLDPLMRVGRQLEETIRRLDPAADPPQRARELLRRVELTDVERVASSYAHELSGGMRQRVMIALALAGRPKLLMADEPTTALDVTVQRRILELLRELQAQEGLTVLLVSHDLGLVSSIASRVTIMYAGMTVETGSVRAVFDSPGHPYTRALMDARPEREASGGLLRTIPGSPPSPAERPGGCPFAPRCPIAQPSCTERPPALESFGADQMVACYRAGERAA